MNKNLCDGVYYVNIDLNHFKLVYNHVIYNINPKDDDYDIFIKIYEYIFIGELPPSIIASNTNTKKGINIPDEYDELYICYLTDKLKEKYTVTPEFRKLALKFFINDNIEIIPKKMSEKGNCEGYSIMTKKFDQGYYNEIISLNILKNNIEYLFEKYIGVIRLYFDTKKYLFKSDK